MLYFYYGEHSYLLAKHKRNVVGRARSLGSLAAVFDEEKPLKIDTLRSALASCGLFQKESVVILDNLITAVSVSQLTSLKKLIENLGVSTSKTCNLYFFETKIDKKNSLAAFLLKKARSTECKVLAGRAFEEKLGEEAKSLGISVGPKEVSRVALFTNYDFWQSVNELTKAHLLCRGQKIEASDLLALPSGAAANDIFKTIDAMSRGDKKTAISLLGKHLQDGDSPFYILTMIAYQFRTILKIKSARESGMSLEETAKKTKLHPFVVRKCDGFASRLSRERLIALYKKIADIDHATKTGAIDIRTALDLFIAFS